MKTKRLIKILLVSCLFFVASGIFAGKASASPRLYFDPANVDSVVDKDLQVNLKIDVESQSSFGADAMITFPGSDLTVKSISKGDFFTDFGSAQSDGVIEIHGYFSTAYQSKSGSGTFAVITLTPKKATGNGNIAFSCSGAGNDTNILNVQGDNILSCGSLNQLAVTFTSGQAPAPDNDNHPTNACGGTCGSNYNCNGDLFCYQGFCRNPNCPSVSNCSCPAATVKPTVKPTAKPVARPTAETITLTKSTPYPSPNPEEGLPTVINQKENQVVVKPILLWVGGGIVGLLIVLIIIKLLMKKNPPKIEPPTTTPPPPTYPPVNTPPLS